MPTPKKKSVQKAQEPESQSFDDTIDFILRNKTDTIVYVLLFIGILTFIFNEIWGGIIVGVIAGFYFADSLIAHVTQANRYIDTEGIFRSFVFGGTLGCIVIAAPFLFLGMLASCGLYYLATKLAKEKGPKKPKKED